MPNRFWRHHCRGREAIEGSPRCATCGAHGAFAGWQLSMWEKAARYHYVYDLSPFGPHRSLADRLLAPLRELCARCGGRAILTLDKETWRECPACEGTGGLWTRPWDEVDAAWRQVVARWPGAVIQEGTRTR